MGSKKLHSTKSVQSQPIDLKDRQNLKKTSECKLLQIANNKHNEFCYQKHKLVKEWSQSRSNIEDQPSRSDSSNNDNARSIKKLKQFLRKQKKQIQEITQEQRFLVKKLQKEIIENNKQIELMHDEINSKLPKFRKLREKISYCKICQYQQKQELAKLEKMKKTPQIEIRIIEINQTIQNYQNEIKYLAFDLGKMYKQIQSIEDIIGINDRINRGLLQTINIKINSIDKLTKDLSINTTKLDSMLGIIESQ